MSPLLKNFLALLPPEVRGAFEFRSTSWFDEEIYEALRERNAALVLADTGEEEKDPPLVRTAGLGLCAAAPGGISRQVA